MSGRFSAVLPPEPIARRLSLQSGAYALGTGLFLAGSAVFFTRAVGLHPAAVGLGLSVAGVVAVLTSVPAGRLADRLGRQRTWWLAALAEGLAYLCYPWVHGFAAFAALMVVLALCQTAGTAARTAYTLGVMTSSARVRTLAYVRSALNIGFTLGALLSGLALAVESSTVLRAIPLTTALVLVCNAAAIARLPAEPSRTDSAPAPRRDRAALRNRPFLALGGLNGLLYIDQVLLSAVFPLWLVTRTDAPHATLAWLYGTNTVLVVLLQVRAARGSETLSGAARAARLAGGCLLAACAVALTAHYSTGAATVVVMALAYVLLTAGELFHAAANWGFVAELSDPDRAAEYQGAWRLGIQVQQMLGPAVLTWLVLSWRPTGLLVVGALALAAGTATGPVARRAARRRTGKPRRAANGAVDTIDPDAPEQ